MKIKVTDKEAENYYNKNKSNYLQVRASHILIKTLMIKVSKLVVAKKTELKKEAEEILKKDPSWGRFCYSS